MCLNLGFVIWDGRTTPKVAQKLHALSASTEGGRAVGLCITSGVLWCSTKMLCCVVVARPWDITWACGMGRQGKAGFHLREGGGSIEPSGRTPPQKKNEGLNWQDPITAQN